ncbi:MAG TPA: glucose 1-dehydrogenase [Chloroflexota bacterium]|nr:glucose 1-dehydrogenase [Chloroflexota bacterium]
MADKLAGRVGLITGTATGIGRAGALLFAREGAALVTLDVNEERGRQTVAEIAAAGGRATFVHGDVARAADVERAVRTAVQEHGKLDLLWSNAGIPVFKTIVETTEEEWDRIVDVNLKGSYLVARFGIPELQRAGGGTMVLTASVSSVIGARRWAAYCATKGGVLMLCRAMALDYADQNIRINCICPGSTDTPLQEADMRSRDIPYEQAVREDKAAHPMNRYGTPDEVARAALFLSCDDSSFTTGSALFVDGGLTAY